MSSFFRNERVRLSRRGKKTFTHLVNQTGIVLEERRSPLWGKSVIVQFIVDDHWERIYAAPNELMTAEKK